MTDTESTTGPSTAYDIVIIGGSAGGLSVAVSSIRSGVKLVRIIERGSAVAFPGLIGENQLDVGFGEEVSSIDLDADGEHVIVTTNKLAYRTRAVLVADRPQLEGWAPDVPISIDSRVHIDDLSQLGEHEDVLVVGASDGAVELTAAVAELNNRVVLAARGLDPSRLSPAGDAILRRLERDRKATVLYRFAPDAIGDVEGFPMAYFDDRRTPDLQFDHVVFAAPRRTPTPAEINCTEAAATSGKVWMLGEPTGDEAPDEPPVAPGWRIGPEMAQAFFPELDTVVPDSSEVRRRHTGAIDELRAEHYNAVITHFEPTHSDLWVLRVKPDDGDTSYLPGQYATLGLGYWEDRVDDATDSDLDNKWEKLIRRSYSISSRMFDDTGYLTDENANDELEFYIVLVAPTEDNTPALTPRLALKRPGDRLYLGPKVAGRYTLNAVQDPNQTIIFLSTGTGEAPHNGMVIDLLRRGHVGPIVSAVSVRQWQDLGYIDSHRTLEERYPNYHYLPLPTREPDVEKRYIQSLVEADTFSNDLGVELHPDNTHVFLCGNPAMIGLPEEEDDKGNAVYPEVTGVVELLSKRGFTLDRRKAPGNIHYEEYW